MTDSASKIITHLDEIKGKDHDMASVSSIFLSDESNGCWLGPSECMQVGCNACLPECLVPAITSLYPSLYSVRIRRPALILFFSDISYMCGAFLCVNLNSRLVVGTAAPHLTIGTPIFPFYSFFLFFSFTPLKFERRNADVILVCKMTWKATQIRLSYSCLWNDLGGHANDQHLTASTSKKTL